MLKVCIERVQTIYPRIEVRSDEKNSISGRAKNAHWTDTLGGIREINKKKWKNRKEKSENSEKNKK